MTILAVDTTSETASLGLRRKGQLIAQQTLQSSEGFAHLIFGALEQLLASARVELREVDCFAAASGPGSFTGVRVGLTLVKGLAEAERKPAVAVSNLRALSSYGTTDHRAVLLDARRNQVYSAVYGPDLEPLVPEVVMDFPAWVSTVARPVDEFIALSGSPFAIALRDAGLGETPFVEVDRGLASSVALCAELDERLGRWQDPAGLDANYVRQSDAELFWKDSRS